MSVSLFQGYQISVGDNKAAVILDIGEAYTKAGLAGAPGPQCIIPSEVRCRESGKIVKLRDCFGDTNQLYDILVEHLHALYFRYLLVNPKECRVVVTESLFSATNVRETIAKVLFKHYEVPSVLFAPGHLMALFTLGIETALVLDVGYRECLAVPVVHGVPLVPQTRCLPTGGKALHAELRLLLSEAVVRCADGVDRPLLSLPGDTLTEDAIEDIKVRGCFVANRDRSEQPPPPVSYPLGGDRVLLVEGRVRESLMENFFLPDDEGRSLASILHDAVLAAPIDARRGLLGNVVVTGGGAMVPGFQHRLMAELRELVASSNRLSPDAVKFHEPPAKENCVAWLGAAIFGSLEVLELRSIQRSQYLKLGRVPDWCTLTQPDLVPFLTSQTSSRRLL